MATEEKEVQEEKMQIPMPTEKAKPAITEEVAKTSIKATMKEEPKKSRKDVKIDSTEQRDSIFPEGSVVESPAPSMIYKKIGDPVDTTSVAYQLQQRKEIPEVVGIQTVQQMINMRRGGGSTGRDVNDTIAERKGRMRR